MVESGSILSCGPRKACKVQQQTCCRPQDRSCGWPPENSCWEWNLEETLQSTISRSQEPEALDTSTMESLLWDGLWAIQFGGQTGESLALSWFVRGPWPSSIPPHFQRAREDQQVRLVSPQLPFPASGEQLCCRTGLESCNYPDRIRAILGRSRSAAKAFDFLN